MRSAGAGGALFCLTDHEPSQPSEGPFTDHFESNIGASACRGEPADRVGSFGSVPPRRDHLNVGLELAGIDVRGASWVERCTSSIENASAYVVSLITVVEHCSLALVSTYVGDLHGEVAVTHMWLPPGHQASFRQRVLTGLPGTAYPRACVLDHSAELRTVLEDLLDEPIGIEISERSLEDAARVWRVPAVADRRG
jgi:hypothetical protein